MLYIVPTPIGNLKDITYRAVEVLSGCDYILCEDTRHSAILLNHYQIKRPLRSYHSFNEAKFLTPILTDLKAGMNIALISDGGTPGICDPGAMLIRACRKERIPLTSLPGPSAVTTAFSLWGESEMSFQFLGFFPRKEKEANIALTKALNYEGISIFYESPQRLSSTLQLISHISPERELLVIRELSKTFEELKSGAAKELFEHFSLHPAKGECVLLIGSEDKNPLSCLSVEDLLSTLQDTYHLSLTDAVKTAAHIKEMPKQSIYKLVHNDEM